MSEERQKKKTANHLNRPLDGNGDSKSKKNSPSEKLTSTFRTRTVDIHNYENKSNNVEQMTFCGSDEPYHSFAVKWYVQEVK